MGIVASKLKDIFHRPVILFSYENGLAYGSGRSIHEFSLIECLDACRELFLNYGGHRLAAGCSLPRERMDDFKSAVNGRAEALLSEDDLRRKIRLDATLGLEELDGAFLSSYRLLSPFGAGNPTPVFLAAGVTVAGAPRRLKNKHVKFPVRQAGRTFEAVGWERGAWADEVRPGDRLDLACTLQSSFYLGNESIVLSLQDIRRAE
jgi:single-stranded-DNA-specific exonuclease